MVRNFVFNVVRVAAAAAVGFAVGATPVVWAQEGDNMIDLSKLVFFKGDAYSVTYEDSVSTKAVETATVRKIGYGQTTIVNVTTTDSGVYSSDAMTSPYILYPGVHVEKLPPAADDSEGGGYRRPPLAYWSDAEGWVATPFVTAGSFAIVARTPTGTVVISTEGNCVVTNTAARC